MEEEADETLFWLEFTDELKRCDDPTEPNALQKEANALVSIFSAAVRTIKARKI